MKCPKCEKPSQTRCAGGSTFGASDGGFIDENGKEHHHNVDVEHRRWECSAGHEWTIEAPSYINECCGGKRPTVLKAKAFGWRPADDYAEKEAAKEAARGAAKP